MFFEIPSTVKKKALYRERYVLPGPLSDTQNQKYLKSLKKSNKNASKIRYGRTLVERIPIGTTGLVQLNFIHNLI